jgi:hypothetical protein
MVQVAVTSLVVPTEELFKLVSNYCMIGTEIFLQSERIAIKS